MKEEKTKLFFQGNKDRIFISLYLTIYIICALTIFYWGYSTGINYNKSIISSEINQYYLDENINEFRNFADECGNSDIKIGNHADTEGVPNGVILLCSKSKNQIDTFIMTNDTFK